jgi:sec-independent protein translocase protein TatA
MNEYIGNLVAIQLPSGMDWFWILLIALLIFGGAKLPQLARSLGKSMSEFKKGMREADEVKDEALGEVKKVQDDVAKEIKDAGKGPDSNNN